MRARIARFAIVTLAPLLLVGIGCSDGVGSFTLTERTDPQTIEGGASPPSPT